MRSSRGLVAVAALTLGVTLALGDPAQATRGRPRWKLRPRATHGDVVGEHFGFAPDGRWFSTGGTWNVVVWKDARPGPAHTVLVGDFLAVAGRGARLLHRDGVFDVATGETTRWQIPLERGMEVRLLAASADERHLAVVTHFRPPRTTGGDRRSPDYREFGPSRPSGPASALVVGELAGTAAPALRQLLGEEARGVVALAFGPAQLQALDTGAGVVHRWERGSFRALSPLPLGDWRRLHRLALSARGDRLAAYGGVAGPGEGGRVIVWDPASGRELARIQTGPVSVTAVAFHPTAGLLATGDDAGEIALWELARGKGRRVARHRVPPSATPFGRRVSGLAFTPKGDLLLAGLDLDGRNVVVFDVGKR